MVAYFVALACLRAGCNPKDKCGSTFCKTGDTCNPYRNFNYSAHGDERLQQANRMLLPLAQQLLSYGMERYKEFKIVKNICRRQDVPITVYLRESAIEIFDKIGHNDDLILLFIVQDTAADNLGRIKHGVPNCQEWDGQLITNLDAANRIVHFFQTLDPMRKHLIGHEFVGHLLLTNMTKRAVIDRYYELMDYVHYMKNQGMQWLTMFAMARQHFNINEQYPLAEIAIKMGICLYLATKGGNNQMRAILYPTNEAKENDAIMARRHPLESGCFGKLC